MVIDGSGKISIGGESREANLEIGCIVVAGGKGSRLGRDKVKVTVGSKSLLERVLDVIGFFNQEVVIVTSGKESFHWLTNYPGHREVADIYPSGGPLVGIFTGLTASRWQYNLVVACDMPFLNRAFLNYMIHLKDGFDLVIPRVGDKVEPLHAVYSKSCLAAIEDMIKQNKLSTYELPSRVKVRYVESDEIDRFDPRHLSFFNVNTKADLDMARELVRRGEIVNANR